MKHAAWSLNLSLRQQVDDGDYWLKLCHQPKHACIYDQTVQAYNRMHL